MLIRTLAAGAALAMLVSGAATAAPHSKARASAAVASPKEPIPYAQLDAYLKASPKVRASKDWWSGSAATGMSTDTSATMPPAASSTDTSVNPSTTTPPAASTTMPDSSTTMPPAAPTSPDATTPPAAPTTPDATTPQTPTEPK